jgi:hypothetical protein
MQPNNIQSNTSPAPVAPTGGSLALPNTPTHNVNVPQTAAAPNMQGQASSIGSQPSPQGSFPAPQVAAPATDKPTQPTEVKPKNPNSTQNSLLISEIHDNMMIMNDGSFRALVACKSINFDLMSSVEQESIEVFFQNFLNSLYFPVQIFVRSQRIDMEPYLNYLNDLRVKQENMLLANLMEDYMNFIDQVSLEANIMKKSFFVIVEFNPYGDIDSQTNSTKNLFSNLFSSDKHQKITVPAKTFQKAKEEIENRVNTVINGLGQIGIDSVRVTTRELATVFYNIYNPDTAVNEPLADFRSFTNLYVSKGIKQDTTEVKNG